MMIYVPDVKVGDKFGKLTFLEMAGRDEKSRQWKWLMKCDCGNTKVVMGCNVRHGKTTSCGCHQKARTSETMKTHGKSGSMIHSIWKGMRQRCYNEKNPNYENYGGRGIEMCPSWKESFESFYKDMGDPPSEFHSLDRIDNDLGYYPDNVRWATDQTQILNRRVTVRIESEDGKLPLKTACLKYGMNYYKAYDLIVRRKMDAKSVIGLLRTSKEPAV